MSYPPMFSIVIPARNAAGTLTKQLQAIRAMQWMDRAEVIVSDNGSTDRTAELVQQAQVHMPNLQLVSSSDKAGINHARNVGVRATTTEYVLLCDADDVISHNWGKALVTALGNGADMVGGALAWINHLGEKVNATASLEDSLQFLPWAFGANCGFRKQVWEDLAGFDETFRGGGDETDFFWRGQLAGYTLTFVPDAEVAYATRDSLIATFRQSLAYGSSHVRLHQKFQSLGMRLPSHRRRMRNVVLLAGGAVLSVFSAHIRLSWVRLAGEFVGRFLESLRQRHLFL